MSDDVQRLAGVEEELERVQERIRGAAQQRAALLQGDEPAALSELDADLTLLRQQRQSLVEQRHNLRRELGIVEQPLVDEASATAPLPAQLAPPLAAEPALDGSVETQSPAAPVRRPVVRASGGPPLAVRLLTLLLVLAGVALVVGGGLFFLADRFGLLDVGGGATAGYAGEDDLLDLQARPDESLEERALRVYLNSQREALLAAAGNDEQAVLFVVEPGETAATIAARLAEQGFVSDATLFRRLLQWRKADQSLAAGSFELRQTMTMDEVIAALQQSQFEEVVVTFPEGWRAEQMADLLVAEGLIASPDDYMSLVADPSRFEFEVLADLPPGSTLEGYLFPDTYRFFAEQATAESIIQTQLQTFEQRVGPELRAEAAARTITLHEALILASIVEREAVIAEERPTIAGVYFNRWNDGTVLNADPTIQYALGFQPDQGDWWKRPLSADDLQLDSPYNSYTNRGLPPGPIASPGLDAIRATIQAPPTEFYYFVSRNDGSHVFAVTLEEHVQNVAEFQSGP